LINFTKLHGAGNDFIIVDNRDNNIADKHRWAKKACDRHFGVGADGLMLVEYSENGDIKMDFYNADGSHSTMCGNGLRCFSKFVYDESIVRKDVFDVETGDGIKTVSTIESGENESIIRVDMGSWTFKSPTVNCLSQEVINRKIMVDQDELEITCVHMGVPHGIIFVDEIDENFTCKYGRKIEKDPFFPQGINVNFVKIIDKDHIIVDTWERGAGKTLACGTGSCASVIIGHRLGKVSDEAVVDVAGGQLKIKLYEDHVTMEGKAVRICTGILY